MSGHAVYRYRALRPDGGEERGTIEAGSADQVVRHLARRGLLAIEARVRVQDRDNGATMSWADLALGLRMLANLVQAGLALDVALSAMAESAPESWRRPLTCVRAAVSEGEPLSAGLQRARVFPALLVRLVEAGEAAGTLPRVVSRAASVAESAAATGAALRGAIAYPVILLGAGLVSLGFLTLVVLPRFATILQDLGQTPPASTRLVLGAGGVARTLAVPGALIVAAATIGWRRLLLSPVCLRRWHGALLRVPLLGRLRRSLATARAADAVGALLESGAPAEAALATGARACGDAAVAAALDRCRAHVLQGSSISGALAREGALTVVAQRMARIGEETGRIGAMFLETARAEQVVTDQLLRRVVQLIEPAFVLAFGALVGLVATALLQALYGIRPT